MFEYKEYFELENINAESLLQEWMSKDTKFAWKRKWQLQSKETSKVKCQFYFEHDRKGNYQSLEYVGDNLVHAVYNCIVYFNITEIRYNATKPIT